MFSSAVEVVLTIAYREAVSRRHRSEVQERQPHRLLELPDGIGADEDRGYMRFDRVVAGQVMQEPGGLTLLGRDAHKWSGAKAHFRASAESARKIKLVL